MFSRQLGEVGSSDAASSEELTKYNEIAGELCCNTDEATLCSGASFTQRGFATRRAREHVSESNQTVQGRMKVAYMCLNIDFQTSSIS